MQKAKLKITSEVYSEQRAMSFGRRTLIVGYSFWIKEDNWTFYEFQKILGTLHVAEKLVKHRGTGREAI